VLRIRVGWTTCECCWLFSLRRAAVGTGVNQPSRRLARALTFWSNALEVMRVVGVWKGLSITCTQDSTHHHSDNVDWMSLAQPVDCKQAS